MKSTGYKRKAVSYTMYNGVQLASREALFSLLHKLGLRSPGGTQTDQILRMLGIGPLVGPKYGPKPPK